MLEQQALFEKFLTFLQTTPPLPEYLGDEPESATPFDPYQMVAEWIALRHEVKQQGKLLKASQDTLQQALTGLEIEKAQLQQQLEASQKQNLVQVDQKTMWRDLLSVVDALDQACMHWEAQIESLAQSRSQSVKQPLWWQRLRQLTKSEPDEARSASASSSLRDVLVSNQEGVNLIRRSLLDVLRQRNVIPIEAQGHPFNPQKMYAVGRQQSVSFPENTVIQEVVRGYLWGEQVLREAQVIVAVRQE